MVARRTQMTDETKTLAGYAAGLSHDEIPAHVLERAKLLLIDTVGIGYRGSRVGWIDIVRRFVGDPCPGPAATFAEVAGRGRAETAALVNGMLVHGLEMDSLRRPGVGVHPGASIVPAALAVAQERGADGKELLTAIVAACEVLIRVGKATRHTIEAKGFHAPAISGPYGAAVAAGRLFGLDAARMASALGIAGSMSGGLLQFAAGGGPLVKRLHLGRSAEGGVAAARWAHCGLAGPDAVLEGRYGFLNGYCGESEPAALVAGLGETYETLTICFKRYACHITAHMPVFAIEQFRAETDFVPAEVVSVAVRGSQRMVDHNADPHPADPIAASYSVPFCVAVAIAGRQHDPESFGAASLDDPQMRRLRDVVRIEKREGSGGHSDWTAEVEITLRDGRVLRRYQEDFPGTPTMPPSAAQVGERFLRLAGPVCGEAGARSLLERLENIEVEERLDWIGGLPA